MTSTDVFLILLSLGLSFVAVYFQYVYKNTTKSRTTLILAVLRFLSIFFMLLLLINPIIVSKDIQIEKTPLPIWIDNSSSIKELNATVDVQTIVAKLRDNKALNEKFDINYFQFDKEFKNLDTLDFKGNQTGIEILANHQRSSIKSKSYPTLLITDGNQTFGNDYLYSFPQTSQISSIVLGDTTKIIDLKIAQLNVNKYAFYKNKFPVEVFINYNGNKTIETELSIANENSTISKQKVTFSNNEKSKIVTVLLEATKVGVQKFKAQLNSKLVEKNKTNNLKNFAVEVIDQKSEIALITSINHPDVGALKRSIENNEQRKVSIFSPMQDIKLDTYNLFILYQPNAEFKKILESIQTLNINCFIITGTQTDYNFLNKIQSDFLFSTSNQKEDYQASFNTNFSIFALDNIGFEAFPPLQNLYGTIQSKNATTSLLSATINGIKTENDLFAFIEDSNKRRGFLFGENIWKWRAFYFKENQTFDKFDLFIDKTIQFLITNATKKRLVVTHENFYNFGDNIEITAQYFNKNYEFDENALLSIKLSQKGKTSSKNFELIRSNNAYKINLDGLEAGEYSFIVKEQQSNTTYTGKFEVIAFDIEKQFVNPDYDRLKQLATQSSGAIFLPNEVDKTIDFLLKNDNYKNIQKEIIKKSPLIDWIVILILIVLTLALEWGIRKYNGLL